MTEVEWLTVTDPHSLLTFLGTRRATTERKLRLLGVAFCRQWDLFTDARILGAIESTEELVDGKLEEAERSEAEALALVAYDAELDSYASDEFEITCLPVLTLVAKLPYTAESASACAGRMAHSARCAEGVFREDIYEELGEAQFGFVRDIFGNPFRPVAVDPTWLTSNVVALAEGIYQERAFDRMPILADALMDAGCDHADVLNHCRSESVHLRGCWVIDLLTGRK